MGNRTDVALLELVRPSGLGKVGWLTADEGVGSDGDERRNSVAQVVNAKLMMIAVKRTRKRLFVCFSGAGDEVEDEKLLREKMPMLYNELWDLAQDNTNVALDCVVLQKNAARFFRTEGSGAADVTVVWSAGNEIDPGCLAAAPTGTCKDLQLVSLRGELTEEVFGVEYTLFDNSREGFLPKFPKVVVGGTFDHFHNGHKKLIGICCAVAQQELVCGVTSSAMLKNKKFGELMQSFDERKQHVLRFLKAVADPGLKCDPVEINDVWGPTVVISDIDAIVVSTEVLKSARLINEERAKKGFAPLKVIAVARCNAFSLSSTFVRRQMASAI